MHIQDAARASKGFRAALNHFAGRFRKASSTGAKYGATRIIVIDHRRGKRVVQHVAITDQQASTHVEQG